VKHLEEDFHQLPDPFPSLAILPVTSAALQAYALLCPSSQLTSCHTAFDYVTLLTQSKGNFIEFTNKNRSDIQNENKSSVYPS
jgi:hypothetical protein